MIARETKHRKPKASPNKVRDKGGLSTISERVRYARVNNGIDPGEMMRLLKTHKLKVSKQLLSLYETSAPQNPSLKIVESISKITGYSTNWLLFGTSPVKNIDPFLQIVRFTNFKSLVDNSGSRGFTKKQCQSVGIAWELYLQHCKTPFIPSMSDEFARAIELVAKKPVGWLDEAPIELNTKELQNRLTDIQEIISASLSLNARQRRSMITFLSAISFNEK